MAIVWQQNHLLEFIQNEIVHHFRCNSHDLWCLHECYQHVTFPSSSQHFLGIFATNFVLGSTFRLHGVFDVLEMDFIQQHSHWTDLHARLLSVNFEYVHQHDVVQTEHCIARLQRVYVRRPRPSSNGIHLDCIDLHSMDAFGQTIVFDVHEKNQSSGEYDLIQSKMTIFTTYFRFKWDCYLCWKCLFKLTGKSKRNRSTRHWIIGVTNCCYKWTSPCRCWPWWSWGRRSS